MKAIIMAGGEGTRLRPLTCDCPKPMMRVLDRPVMEYSLSLLSRHGVTDAAVTLGYLPHCIMDFFGEEAMGVRLEYFIERTPLGTAGGVYSAREFLTETFCVISGDAVTDADLTKALEFHRSKNSKATIVLKRVADPMAYGLVITSPDCRITRFLEKPSWGEVVSDTVNTGIYILEPDILPLMDHVPCDFGRDIFPALARQGLLHGWVTDGYWCDIGDISAYMQVNRDAMDGKIDLPGMHPGTFIHPSARINRSAVIEDPVYIGPGVCIGHKARVGAYTVLGENSRLGDLSGTKRSILWPGAGLDEGAQARGAVLGKESVLGCCARAFESGVMGTGSRAMPESELAPGACIWPGKTVMESVRQDANLIWGQSFENRAFRSGVLPVHSPGDAIRAAQAFAACRRPEEVLLARTSSPMSAAIWHGCACGLMAQGVRVLDGGICTEPQLRHAISLVRPGGALLAADAGVIPFAGNGCRVSLADQRAICALIARQDFPRPFSSDSLFPAAPACTEHAYIAHLASAFTADPENAPRITISAKDPYLLDIAARAFSRAGLSHSCMPPNAAPAAGETCIILEKDGNDISIVNDQKTLSDAGTQLLRAWTLLESGEKSLLLPGNATRAIEEIAQNYSAETKFIHAARPDYEHALQDHSAIQLRCASDGLFFALSALSALAKRSLTVENWLSSMPAVHRARRTVALADTHRGSIMRAFAEMQPDSHVENGITLRRKNAVAWISPDDSRPECSIVSESRDAEFADELCAFCEKALLEAIKNADGTL